MLYWDPAAGLEAATTNVRSAVYFLVLPVAGLVAGGYAYVGGPYAAVSSFLFGSYLDVFGLGLTLGRLLAPDPVGPVLAIGIGLAALVLAVLVANVFRTAGAVGLGLGLVRSPSD
ncbi:MAG: hypothetical protein ABEI11_02495 [Haloarculaceae archaeon]